MNHEKNTKYYTIICTLLLSTLFCGVLYFRSAVRVNQLGRLNNQLTERLVNATNSCAELERQLNDCRETIGHCRDYCNEIDGVSNRSISTARDAIEIIEETREAIGAMEVTLGLWDSDGYYNWLDSYIFDSEVNND